MKTTRTILAFCLIAFAGGANAGAVVVAKSSPLVPLSTEDARRIFLGLQHNVNDQTVNVIFQRSGQTREDFNVKVLGKTGSELTAYMAARIFAGRAVPPTEVGTDDDVKRMLANTPGAIGYVSDGAVDDSMKVLLKF